MPENDLKLICDAIPCSDSGTVSTQATNIYKGITGETVEFNINTGSSPTLFSPIINQDALNYSVTYNSQNGAFCSNSDLVVTVDGNPAPLSGNLTTQDNGKVIQAVLSKENFTSSSASKIIHIPDADPGLCTTDYLTTSEVSPNAPLMLVLGRQSHAFITYKGLSGNLSAAIEISDDNGVTWRHPGPSSSTYYKGIIAVMVTQADFEGTRPVLNLTGSRFRMRFCHTSNTALITLVPWVGSLDNCNVQFFSRGTPGTPTGLASDMIFRVSSQDIEFNYNNFTWSSMWTGESGDWIDYTATLGRNGRFNCVIRWVDTKERVTTINPAIDIQEGSPREISISLEHFN